MDVSRASASRPAAAHAIGCRAGDTRSHGGREVNEGEADWLIAGITSLGVPFEAIYDHPVGDDETTVLMISAWRASSGRPAR
jgi:hypothetical protein